MHYPAEGDRVSVRHPGFRPWLERNAHTSIQEPYWFAAKAPYGRVDVYDTRSGPLEVASIPDSQGSVRKYILAPHLTPNLEDTMEDAGLDRLTTGFQFCDPSSEDVARVFPRSRWTSYTQIVQYTSEFPSLDSPENRHRRQNAARTERQGMRFEPNILYQPDQVSDLVISWVGQKASTLRTPEEVARALKVAQSIDQVARNPYGRLYGSRNGDGQLRAIIATLEIGDFASVEHVASYRGEDRAQEYTETMMWQSFVKSGVARVSRGNAARQPPSLLRYKAKFAPLHRVVWASSDPICSISKA